MNKVDLKVKIAKGFDKAILPIQTTGSACLDLIAATELVKMDIKAGATVEYDTGLEIDIPEGYVGLVIPKGDISSNTSLVLGSGIGIIQCGDTGTLKFHYRNISPAVGLKYSVGDLIGQLMILPVPFVNLIATREANVENKEQESLGTESSSGKDTQTSESE